MVTHTLELLAPLGVPRAKFMFGGHGLYVDDLFVAIVADEVVYLKVDALTQADFEAAHCRRFVYIAAGKTMGLNYWTVPEDALDSPAGFQPWARRALAAALRSRAALKPSPRRARSPRG